MELSTSIPTPSARPAREIMFRFTFEKYISTIASIKLIGILNDTTRVGLKLFKNSSKMMTARTPPISRFCITEPITMSIYTP